MSTLNDTWKATVIDPIVASYSERVIFIKDGSLYTQTNKGDQSRKAFLKDIMKIQGVLGGVHNEH